MGLAAPIILGAMAGAAAGMIMAQMIDVPTQDTGYSAGSSKRGAEYEKPIAYGRTQIDGHFVFDEPLNEPLSIQTMNYIDGILKTNQAESIKRIFGGGLNPEGYMTFILTFGEGPINAFKQIYIDDAPLFDNEMNIRDGVVGYNQISPMFRDHIQVELSCGDRVDPHWLALAGLNSDNEWTLEHRLFGMPAIALKIKLDPKDGRVKSTFFNVRADVEGRIIKDIRRTDAAYVFRTTDGKEPGRNTILCVYDYLTDYYGGQLDDFQIDMDSFIRAANNCDTNGMYLDGVVNQKQDVLKNVKEMLSSCGARLTYINGLFGIHLDQPSIISGEFSTDENIIGKVKYTTAKVENYFNQLEVQYRDQTTNKQEIVLYPPTIPDDVIARDGRRIQQRMELKFSTTKSNIDFLASREFIRSQYSSEIQFETDINGFLVTVGDVISVTVPELNLFNKTFRITKQEPKYQTCTVGITAEEYNEKVYSAFWKGDHNQSTPRVYRTVKAPENLRTQVVPYGAGFTVKLLWDNDDPNVYRHCISYKSPLDNDSYFAHEVYAESNNEYLLFDLMGGHYDFKVVAYDMIGTPSKPAFLRKVDLKDDTIIPQIKGLKLLNGDISQYETSDTFFRIGWDSALDEPVQSIDQSMNPYAIKANPTVKDIFSHYEIDVLHGKNFKGTYRSPINEFQYSQDMIAKNGSPRDVQMKVRIVSRGSASSVDTIINVQNPQVKGIQGAEGTGGISGIKASWLQCTERDYSGTEVHISEDPNFVPSTKTLAQDGDNTFFSMPVDTTKKQTFYMYVGHYDVFGRDNIKFSKKFVVQSRSIYDEMTDLTKDNLSKDLNTFINSTADEVQKAQAQIKANKTDVESKLDKTKTDLMKDLNQARADLTASITDVKKISTDGDAKQAAQLQALQAKGEGTQADLTAFKGTVNEKDKAVAEQIQNLTATTAKADQAQTAELKRVEQASTAADKAQTTRIDTLSASTTKATQELKTELKADISKVEQAGTTADQAMSKRVDALSASTAASDSQMKADLTRIEQASTAADKALVERVDALQTSTQKDKTDLQAKITTVEKASTESDKAHALKLTQVETSIGGVKAQAESTAKTVGDIQGNMTAMYGMKVQADGTIASIGLIADSKTQKSEIVFNANNTLFTVPGKGKYPILEITDKGVLIPKALIGQMDATQIEAGAIQAHHIKANVINANHIQAGTINGNHITAGVSLNAPDLIMPDIRLNSGAAGFGKGGPFGGWGEQWNTIIYSNGTLCTNKINATGGSIANLEVKNCTITEDCHINGWLYANKIIGMPSGKRFGLGEVGVPLKGQWYRLAEMTVNSPEGRFSTSTIINLRGIAGGYSYSMYGAFGKNKIGIRVLFNGKEVWREVVVATPECDHEFKTSEFSWASIPIDTGFYGGTITVEMTNVSMFRSSKLEWQYNWEDSVPIYNNRPYNILINSMSGFIYNAINQ